MASRTHRSPEAVRQSGPFGKDRRSIRCKSLKRVLVPEAIWDFAQVPSISARVASSIGFAIAKRNCK